MSRRFREITTLVCLGLLPTLLRGLFPLPPLNYAAPLMIYALYRLSLERTLWLALGLGLLLDLLAGEGPFGLNAQATVGATLVAYRFRRHFFQDGWLALPVLTLLFALASTLFLVAGHQLLGEGFSPNLRWALTDLLLLPSLDAAWAFTCFTLPLKLLFGRRRLARYRMSRPR
jgi:hypothetical protein